MDEQKEQAEETIEDFEVPSTSAEKVHGGAEPPSGDAEPPSKPGGILKK